MRDILQETLSSIKQNVLRTSLTGFAVAWGIFMLIVLLGTGNGVLNALLASEADSMEHSMVAYQGRTSKAWEGFEKGRRIDFDTRDVDALEEGDFFTNYVDEVCPAIYQTAQLTLGDKFFTGTILGLTPVFKDIQNVQILSGRFINTPDCNERRKVVVIGSSEVQQLLGMDAKMSSIVGRWVKIGPFSYQVVGVYKSDESRGGGSPDLYAPYTTISTIYNMGKHIPQIYFSFHGIETEEQGEAFEEALRRGVNSRHMADPTDRSTMYLWNRLSSSQQIAKAIRIINIALWILGIFTLLSGIVGVSNIMLISVKERTHEFGIRKAIGATPGYILTLIITESVIITAFFGYIGMVGGLLANHIMDLEMGGKSMDAGIVSMKLFVNPTVGMDVAIGATVLLIVAGTIAGLIPAWKASHVKPIEALRQEK